MSGADSGRNQLLELRTETDRHVLTVSVVDASAPVDHHTDGVGGGGSLLLDRQVAGRE